MSALNQSYHGKSAPASVYYKLRAGNIDLLYRDGFIRNVMVGDREIVRMIYGAVRDPVWNTIAPSLVGLRIGPAGSSFKIEFDCRYKKGIADFIWHGTISGTPDSTIRFSMQGRALSSFQSNRIGLCVLHPLSECLGKPCTIMTTKGKKISGRFPSFGSISPRQPFKNMRAIIQTAEGIESRITFRGDTFEMEDQRNWTDASFKSYCPPLSRPHPYLVKKGDRIFQEVEIAVSVKSTASRKSGKTALKELVLRTESAHGKIPEIGCGAGNRRTAAGLRRAGLLRLSHVRVDVNVTQSATASALKLVDGIPKNIKVPLELALHFSKNPLNEQISFLPDLCAGFRSPVKRILVFRHGEAVTSGPTMRDVLPALGRSNPTADIVTGTDSYFVEINRDPPRLRGVNGICYSVNPQVHTSDDLSVLDNLEGQFYTVRNARRLGRGAPVYVTPVTLRPRLNPDVPEKFHGADARQKSLLGAVWTLGSIVQLTKGGAAGATYFELSGPRGVMDKTGRRVYPLFHVIADVNEFSGGTMRILSCGPRSDITGCLLEKQGRKRYLVANRSMEKKEIAIPGVPGTVSMKSLDETTFAEACAKPELFRKKKGRMLRPQAGLVKTALLPYGIVRFDG